MNVLVVVPPYRKDFYGYLEAAPASMEFSLLWYEQPQETSHSPFFAREYFWADFATPGRLLNRVKPDKIVLFEIIDQRQIALLVAANARGISTFYLEHGAAAHVQTAHARTAPSLRFYIERYTYLFNRLFKDARLAIKTKIFYYAALPSLRSVKSAVTYSMLPFRMLFAKPNKVLSSISLPERIPKHAIVFNEINFQEYQAFTGAKPSSAIYTGLPMFDPFYRHLSSQESGEVVYLDHPYLEENLLGWDKNHHEKIARALYDMTERYRVKLLVKLHPRSGKEIWDKYNFDSNRMEIVQEGDYVGRFMAASLVLGYSSSLVTGLLCARKNVVLLGWHPDPQLFGYNFHATNLCHVSFDIGDIHTAFSTWLIENKTLQNKEAYDTFIKENNYPFDGMAAKRVIEHISQL